MFLGMPWALQTKIEAALDAFTKAQEAKRIADLAEAATKWSGIRPLLDKAITELNQN